MPIVFLSILLTPIFDWLWKRISDKKCVITLITVFIIYFLVPLLFKDYSDLHWIIYICPFWRMLEFFSGGLLYILNDNILKNNKMSNAVNRKNAELLCTSGLVLQIIMIYISTIQAHMLYYTCVWIIPSSMIILGIYNSKYQRKLFENKYIVAIGGLSFEIFLTHLIILSKTKVYGKAHSYDITWVYDLMMILLAAYVLKQLDVYIRGKLQINKLTVTRK